MKARTFADAGFSISSWASPDAQVYRPVHLTRNPTDLASTVGLGYTDRMKTTLHVCCLFLLLLFCNPVYAQTDPTWAVVRLPSHGASATVIQTAPGRTLLLSCGHAFEGPDARKKITVDMPAPTAGAPSAVGVRLLHVDYRLDLSLIEVPAGPVPYVCSVASPGHRPTRAISAGYDEMRITQDGRPSVVKWATLLGTTGNVTWTREIPWHGRSGGALIDADTGVLIGVVQGYEEGGNARGMYVSHQAIIQFLTAASRPGPVPVRPEEPVYRYGQPRQECPGGVCPIQR